MIEITLSIQSGAYQYLSHSGAEERIKRYLSHRYSENIVLKYIILQDRIRDIEAVKQPEVSSYFVSVSNLHKLAGREIYKRPKYIREVKSEGRAVVSGRVKSMYRNVKKDSDEVYYIFTLDDTTGTIRAMYFPKLWSTKGDNSKALEKAKKDYDNKIAVFDKLVDDTAMGDYTVICEGNVKTSNSGDYTLFISNIAKCEIDFDSIMPLVEKRKYPKITRRYFPSHL